MSDSLASPPIEATQPGAPVAFAPGDVDIEMLLDQAQALVDDTADELNAAINTDPDPVDPRSPSAEVTAIEPPSPELGAILADAAADVGSSAGVSEPPSDEPQAVDAPATELLESIPVPQSVAPDIAAPTEATEQSPIAPEQPTQEVAAVSTAAESPSTIETPANPENSIVVEDFAAPAASQSVASAPPTIASTAPTQPPPPEPASQPRRRDALPMRLAAGVILLLDRPFARISNESRRRVGWIAAATFLMGAVAWFAPLRTSSGRPHKQKTPAAVAAGVENSHH